jgi:hypothetical protein
MLTLRVSMGVYFERRLDPDDRSEPRSAGKHYFFVSGSGSVGSASVSRHKITQMIGGLRLRDIFDQSYKIIWRGLGGSDRMTNRVLLHR